MSTAIRFTDREADFIGHRLDAGDALADSLTDFAEGEEPVLPGVTWEQVDARAHELAREIERDHCVTVDTTSALDAEIMRDCVEGSTWLANAEENLEPNQVSAAQRVVARAAEKLARAFGWDSVPVIEV